MIKIRYWTKSGAHSAAYLDETDFKTNQTFYAWDKHTDERVLVNWTGDKWKEIVP